MQVCLHYAKWWQGLWEAVSSFLFCVAFITCGHSSVTIALFCLPGLSGKKKKTSKFCMPNTGILSMFRDFFICILFLWLSNYLAYNLSSLWTTPLVINYFLYLPPRVTISKRQKGIFYFVFFCFVLWWSHMEKETWLKMNPAIQTAWHCAGEKLQRFMLRGWNVLVKSLHGKS